MYIRTNSPRFPSFAFSLAIAAFCTISLEQALAQEPVFSLTLDAPPAVSGDAGSTVSYSATASLESADIATEYGAQGWAIGVEVENGSISAATTAGTDADLVSNGGLRVDDDNFELTEIVGGGQGAISAVVLSLETDAAASLPPSGSVTILDIEVSAVPSAPVIELTDENCDPVSVSLRFVDGLTGSGQAVDNVVSYASESWSPLFGDATTLVCPNLAPRSTRFEARLDEPAGTGGEKVGTLRPWTATFLTGETAVDVEVGIYLISNVAPEDDGVQGWSMSVITDPSFNVSGVTTDGTAGADVSGGGLRSDGFENTELVSPSNPLNNGLEGAVSAVVLSLQSPVFLPTPGEEKVLRLLGQIDTSAIVEEDERTPACVVRPSTDQLLAGSGQPVKSVATVKGASRRPDVCGASIELIGRAETTFIRSDANADGRDDIADAVWIVNDLFRGGDPTTCLDAADANDDGSVDLSDVVFIFDYQFGTELGDAGPPPPPPFGDGLDGCGVDPTEDALDCALYDFCN